MSDNIDWGALAAPFEPDQIEWRVGNKSKRGDKATLLAYLTSRAVQERLDQVVGPANWRDSYQPLVAGNKVAGFLCTIEIRVDGAWVGKTDAADTSDIEAIKGGVSGALKRAAVKWGIGRYLYDYDARYHEIRQGYYNGSGRAVYCPMADKKPGHILVPDLPRHMLPGRATSTSRPGAEPAKPPGAPKKPQAQAQPQPTDDRSARLIKRISTLEQGLDQSALERLRTEHKVGALAEMAPDALIAYGKALAGAVKAAA